MTYRIITPPNREARVAKIKRARDMIKSGYSQTATERHMHVSFKTLRKWAELYNVTAP